MDRDDENHKNSWPMRLPEEKFYKAANIIALHGSAIAERADKLGFRVIDTSENSSQKLLDISKEIFRTRSDKEI